MHCTSVSVCSFLSSMWGSQLFVHVKDLSCIVSRADLHPPRTFSFLPALYHLRDVCFHFGRNLRQLYLLQHSTTVLQFRCNRLIGSNMETAAESSVFNRSEEEFSAWHWRKPWNDVSVEFVGTLTSLTMLPTAQVTSGFLLCAQAHKQMETRWNHVRSDCTITTAL